MSWIDDTFEPRSEINGNIEITFNSKNKEVDPYDPIKEQLILTVGKSGRANRLTFDNLDSEELMNTSKLFYELALQLRKLETELEDAKDGDFDLDDIKAGVPDTIVTEILNSMSEDSTYEIDELSKELDEPEFRIREKLEELFKAGEVFKPNKNEEVYQKI